jgi:2-oxoglutarate ferredoxin oxidoreductase subunit alpha
MQEWNNNTARSCIFIVFYLVITLKITTFAIVFQKLIHIRYIMAEKLEAKELEQVVVRFSGDAGDGMQLSGNIFSTV